MDLSQSLCPKPLCTPLFSLQGPRACYPFACPLQHPTPRHMEPCGPCFPKSSFCCLSQWILIFFSSRHLFEWPSCLPSLQKPLIWLLSHAPEQSTFPGTNVLGTHLSSQDHVTGVRPSRWGVPVGLSFCEEEWVPFCLLSWSWAPPKSTALRHIPMSGLAEVVSLDFPSSWCPEWSPKAGEYPLCLAVCSCGELLPLGPVSSSVPGMPGPTEDRSMGAWAGTHFSRHLAPPGKGRRSGCLSLTGFVSRGFHPGAWLTGVGSRRPVMGLSQEDCSTPTTPH